MLTRLRTALYKLAHHQKGHAVTLSKEAEKGIERNIFKRFHRLKPVRRFVIGWVTLMILLIGCTIAQYQHLSAYYQKVAPVPGGIYSEGMVGSISNVNPIYATGDVDKSLSRLLFTGLLTYDENGDLRGGLAEKYGFTDNGRTYEITLKKGLIWHDGQPITSSDVAFTFNTIKDPDARSPLFASWQNVGITVVNDRTVRFTLPSTLASFAYNLTTGILPQHALADVSAANMRSANFNTMAPIGAGPFKWRTLEVTGNDPSDQEEQVALIPFEAYTLGKPKLSEYIIRAYASKERLQQAYASGQLTAAAGLYAAPTDSPATTVVNSLVQTAGTYAFFKTTTEPFTSVKVRQALVAASQPDQIIAKLGFQTRAVTGPLLTGQLANDKKYAQKTSDVATANRVLAEDGWIVGSDGIARKNGKPLTFRLVAADTPEYQRVANQLKTQWHAIGANVVVQLLPPTDYATALAAHDYDATIYGISIGDDPDVFAYWNGSQADVRSTNRLNISEWKNTSADAALEAGRTRLDPALRTIKYAPFLQAWQQESPALGLYQPRFVYLTRDTVYGLTQSPINNAIDRYNGVHNWQIRTARIAGT